MEKGNFLFQIVFIILRVLTKRFKIMTSFSINNIPSQMPQITEAQNMMNNGGGGNTGYLETGRKKKKKKEDDMDTSFFAEEGEDKFERTKVEFELEDEDEYYNPKPAVQAKPRSLDEKEQNEGNKDGISPDMIKNKFLGLIGKIVKNGEEEKTPPALASGGDFLTFSKKEI